MRLNPIGIIGGIVLIISPFLTWVSVIILNVSLLDIIRLLQWVQSMWSPWMGPLPPEIGYLIGICVLTLILLVIGGIVSFFKGVIGGVIGLIGMLIFTFVPMLLLPSAPIDMTELPIGNILSYLGIGYYLGWIGSIIGIISIFFKKFEITVPPSPPPPTPPPPPP